MEPISNYVTQVTQSDYTQYGYDSYTKSKLQFNDEEVALTLTDLYTAGFVIVKPIPVVLKYDYKEKIYIFVQNDLNLWGDASTLKEAEKELALSIVNLYRRLLNTKKNTLGPYPKELLKYLSRFIVNEAKGF